MNLHPMFSRELCVCGHVQGHHIEGLYRCPVVVFGRDADLCPCAKFTEVVEDAPLDEVMRVTDEQMAKWKTTLDWLAER